MLVKSITDTYFMEYLGAACLSGWDNKIILRLLPWNTGNSKFMHCITICVYWKRSCNSYTHLNPQWRDLEQHPTGTVTALHCRNANSVFGSLALLIKQKCNNSYCSKQETNLAEDEKQIFWILDGPLWSQESDLMTLVCSSLQIQDILWF